MAVERKFYIKAMQHWLGAMWHSNILSTVMEPETFKG